MLRGIASFHRHLVCMERTEIDLWARSFVADLQVGGEAVPLDRVLARHLQTLNELRTYGLTWSAVASIIARAGGRRASGRPISPDQLRANVARLRKRHTRDVTSPPWPRDQTIAHPPKKPRSERDAPVTLLPAVRTGEIRPSADPAVKRTSHISKDLSEDDIAAALSRIQAK